MIDIALVDIIDVVVKAASAHRMWPEVQNLLGLRERALFAPEFIRPSEDQLVDILRGAIDEMKRREKTSA